MLARLLYVSIMQLLAVRKVGHLINIKSIMLDFEARALIGWLADNLASQPMRTHAIKSSIFVLC